MATTAERVGIARTLARGLTRHCANCGGRGLFVRWGRLRERCATCGLWLQRSNGMSMGSLGINTVATFTTLFAVQVLGLVLTWPDFPVAQLVVVALVWAIAFPLAFHHSAQTLWLAIDLVLRPIEPDETNDARPPLRG